jgi:glycosyltransferase involved in cell wall biosynthesis
MTERFGQLGSAQHVYDLTTLRRPWMARRVWALLTAQYDVLYSHTSVPGEILGELAARMARRPHVIHEHAPRGPHFSPHAAIRAGQRALYLRVGAQFIAVAPHVRKALLRSGIRDSRIVVIPNGAPEPSKLPPPKTASARLSVGMIGRLDPQKGIDDFIDATATLDRTALDIRVAARRGPHAAFEDSVRYRLTRAGVELVESLDGASFLAGLDIGVIPSLYEGSPLALFEAMALGRPIVASDIPGMREVIEDGRNGLLVPPRDPSALRAAILRLVTDSELRRRLGAAARDDAEHRFPMRRTIDRCLAILRQVVDEAAAASAGTEGRAVKDSA